MSESQESIAYRQAYEAYRQRGTPENHAAMMAALKALHAKALGRKVAP